MLCEAQATQQHDVFRDKSSKGTHRQLSPGGVALAKRSEAGEPPVGIRQIF
jgi:hypothetical protein